MTHPPAELVLSFEACALERCFLAAEILSEDFGRPAVEYALLGLSTEADPLHVVATPLLPNQRATAARVEQPVRGVAKMRAEIEQLSRERGEPLMPAAFVHRHLGSCKASATDIAFLTGPFIDQIFSRGACPVRREVAADDPHLACSEPAPRPRHDEGGGARGRTLRVERATACSLIVNAQGEHRLYAASKDCCAVCGKSDVRFVPARLAVAREETVSAHQREALRRRLRDEIAARVRFPAAEGIRGEVG